MAKLCLPRFSTKILVIRLVNGGRAVGRAAGRIGGRILNGVKLRFPLNNFSQLGIATQVSVIKVKVTVTKIEIQFPLNNFSLL